ncbi:hypothetical protein DCAR_0207604 [Daucus carota subsp. sativus]|uniref:Uncharacterized protein n=1 Tax=Daucus carota subsp. sativus TaxID=79200 RepID=A0AAF0WEY1_DAUCS|nr:hypothetical protein DCAR_0207604 [Daucus carota subsp. sativus]
MPDSTVLVTTENAEEPEKKRFQRFYTCFGPIKKGFSSGCRPLIGLDGCHLKGPYGGQLLSAIGTDANDGINMWKEHKGIGVRPCLWKAARATTEYTYVKCMDEMKKVHTTLFYFHFNFCLVLPKKVRSKKTDTTPAGATRLKRQNTKVRCSYCTEYSHNLRTCPAKKDDIDDGSTADDGATADDEAKADGGTDDAQTHTPAEGSQGRVFNMQQLGGSTARPSPLGIYPLQFKTRGNATVTSLRNLELARRKREARSKLKPVWKH